MKKPTNIPPPSDSLADTKLRLEIQNLQDTGLSNLEKNIKKRIVPIFLPFITLIATSLFFYITWRSGEKAKAIDRYKSEIDMLDMVWDDIKTSDQKSASYLKSRQFLIAMVNANRNYYINDNEILGIEMNQRPIRIVTNMDMDMRKEVLKIEANAKVEESFSDFSKEVNQSNVPDTMQPNQSILAYKKKEVIKVTDDIANAQMKVYIQYRNKENIDMAQYLAVELKPYYIMPPIDLVENIKYGNQIRYYRKTDLTKAKMLAAHIKNITGQDFVLKNIDKKKINNVMEIWYDNIPINTTVSPQIIKIPDVYKVVFEDNLKTAPKFFIQVTKEIDVYVDAYNENTKEATFRLNEGTPFLLKKDIETVREFDGFRVTLKVTDYKRAHSIHKVVYYSIKIEQKQTKMQS